LDVGKGLSGVIIIIWASFQNEAGPMHEIMGAVLDEKG
jgi:hypothetical protein